MKPTNLLIAAAKSSAKQSKEKSQRKRCRVLPKTAGIALSTPFVYVSTPATEFIREVAYLESLPGADQLLCWLLC